MCSIRVVDDLPAAHLCTEIRERDATRLIDDGHDQRVRVLTGTLVTTYDYSLAGSTEIGPGGGGAPRKQGQWFHALGPVAVVVHSKVVLPLQASSDAPALLAGLEEEYRHSKRSQSSLRVCYQYWREALTSCNYLPT
jgi:hypothetical protein